MQLKSHGGDAGQVRWQFELNSSVVHDKRPIAAEATHKQSQFKKYIVSWSWFGVIPAGDEIIWGENENGEIKLI